MKLCSALPRDSESLLQAQIRECLRLGLIDVGARQCALFREVVIRWIPDLRDDVVRVADAAIDLASRLPETFVGLPAYLAGLLELRCGDCLLELLREVVRYPVENGHWDVAYAKVRAPCGLLVGRLVQISDGDPVRQQLDVLNLSLILYQFSD